MAAAGIGSTFTNSSLRSWYPTLRKPDWTPPGSVIGAVWSVLYPLMGLVAFLAWRERGNDRAAVNQSLRWFGIQLGLNILWSGLFFGLRKPFLGLVGIVALWVSLLAWARSTFRVNRWIALGVVPYVGWVNVAGYLNAAVWWLNR
jgi:tryptophan-rich sensory protein